MFLLQKWKQPFQRDFKANRKAFYSLFPENTKVERIATGFQFIEGPIWIPEKQCLLFSDIPANKILRFDAADQISVFREPSHHSNGLTRDRQGRLIACEHGTRRVTRTEPDGTIEVLVDRFQNKRLNSPNDVVVKSDGSIYFTDPPYGINPDQQEQPIQGVYRLSPDGDLTLMAADFDRPNGLAFSPDEQKLYIADSSSRRHVRVFDVRPDGTLANGKVFQDMNGKLSGVPDGMAVDRQGYLYCTGPSGVWVIDPSGCHLGTIVLPETAANCAWGDADQRTLYITACTSLYRIRVITPGLAAPKLLKDEPNLNA